MTCENREQWLTDALVHLRVRFDQRGWKVPPLLTVEVGHMEIGNVDEFLRCILAGVTPDELISAQTVWCGSDEEHATPRIVMTAATGTAEETLATLVHELVHCTLPVAEDHGPTFQMRVREAGLDGDPRATVPAADFGQQYADVLSALGPLPGDTTPMVERIRHINSRIANSGFTVMGGAS